MNKPYFGRNFLRPKNTIDFFKLSQPCNLGETQAILSRGFRKVSGPKLNKLLTLN